MQRLIVQRRRSLATSLLTAVFLLGTFSMWFMSVAEAGIATWAPPTIQYLAPNSGTGFMCAIANNKPYCWGNTNTYGQLGTGDNTTLEYMPHQVYDPNNVFVGKTLTAIAIASTGTVCVIASNVPYCWGRGNYGVLGDNTTSDRYYPSAATTSGVLAGKVITDIYGGDGHMCVVASGAAYCWGTNGQGRLGDNSTTQRNTPVAVYTSGVLSGKTVTSIVAGSAYSCAVASGAAYCWGDDSTGQLGNSAAYVGSTTPVAVDTSGVMSGKTIVDIAAGTSHTCALASDSTAFCWGTGSVGQLGNNASPSDSAVPVQVYNSGDISGKTLTELSAGSSRSCVLDTNSDAYCWGYSPIGDGSSSVATRPTKINASSTLNGMQIAKIANGTTGSCFLNSLNELYCVASSGGVLGDNTTNISNSPVAVLFPSSFDASNYRVYENADSTSPGSPLAGINSTATLTSYGEAFRVRMGVKTTAQSGQITIGNGYSCAISDGKSYCWGKGGSGRLGNNSTSDSLVPVGTDTTGVLSGKTILALSAYGPATCAIASDNQAYCWGYNGSYGQLGNNSTTTSLVPVAVDTSGVLSGKTILAISKGSGHTCAIASNNQAYCWGLNSSGQLGNSSTTDSFVPVAVNTSGVLSGKTILSIRAGANHTCVVASNNQAYCWGLNTNGRLGNNSTSYSSVPVAVNTSGVLSGKTILSISPGYAHTCAIASDNQAYCWGLNTNGQLGNNSTSQSLVPVAVNTSGVLSGKTILSISASGSSSGSHTCAIASDNQAYCWGYNSNGQLGNNSTSQSLVPVAVDTSGVLSGKTISEISVGDLHTCAIASDNQAYCWGLNTNGRLGNNSTSQSLVPVAVMTEGYIPGADINPSDNTYKLQYAEKTAGSCSAQTGFADITGSTYIAFSTNPSVSNGASITALANDPVPTTDSSPQTYISSSGTFTNTSTIAGDKVGIWDFSLKDNSAPHNTTYCLRMVYGDNSVLETETAYPEITTSLGTLSISFVDAGGVTVSSPTILFGDVALKTIAQTATATLGTSSQKLRVYNDLAANGWSVNFAAIDGATALWNRSDNLAKYDYNDSSGSSDGSDTDLLGGQLSVDPSGATMSSACSLTGLSLGSQSAFDEASVNTLTLMNASSATASGCNFDLTDVGLSQSIPANQPAGTYTLDVTTTVTAL